MEIFEDERMVSRADLAAWLRQLAGQLESDGKVLFGAAGSVTVGDEVHCEFEIEGSGSEMSIEIEFSWTDAGADEDAEESDEEKDEDAEETDREEDAEETDGEAGEQDAAPLSESSAAPAAEPDNSAEEDKGNDATPR